MGQYHLTVNLTKREFLDPHQLGCGLKILEQLGNSSVANALMILLAVSNGRGGGDLVPSLYEPDDGYGKVSSDTSDVVGRWGGDKIAIVGDYAEQSDLDAQENAQWIYAACRFGDESEEERAERAQWYEKGIKEAFDSGNIVEGENLEAEWQWVQQNPFTNISHLVIPYLLTNANLHVETLDSGWKRMSEVRVMSVKGGTQKAPAWYAVYVADQWNYQDRLIHPKIIGCTCPAHTKRANHPVCKHMKAVAEKLQPYDGDHGPARLAPDMVIYTQ